MKMILLRRVFFFFIITMMLYPFCLMAEMTVSDGDQSVKKLGMAWNIAEDRKIENDGGIYQPEGLDKYMKRLIENLSAQIDQLDKQNQRLEKKVDSLIEKTSQLEILVTESGSESKNKH